MHRMAGAHPPAPPPMQHFRSVRAGTHRGLGAQWYRRAGQSSPETTIRMCAHTHIHRDTHTTHTHGEMKVPAEPGCSAVHTLTPCLADRRHTILHELPGYELTPDGSGHRKRGAAKGPRAAAVSLPLGPRCAVTHPLGSAVRCPFQAAGWPGTAGAPQKGALVSPRGHF